MLRGRLRWLCPGVRGRRGERASAASSPPQPGLAWPTEDCRCAPARGCGPRGFDLAVTEAFAGRHELFGDTRAVIVVQGGVIVFERYADGFLRDTRLISWSMAKSVTQALVGVAVGEGRIAINAPWAARTGARAIAAPRSPGAIGCRWSMARITQKSARRGFGE